MDHHKCIHCGMLISEETSQFGIDECAHELMISTKPGSNQDFPVMVGLVDGRVDPVRQVRYQRVFNEIEDVKEEYCCQHNWLKIQLLFYDTVLFILKKLNKKIKGYIAPLFSEAIVALGEKIFGKLF